MGKKGKGSRKGSSWEREFCKMLSVWWAGRDDIFWRTPTSGGMATTRKKVGKDARGMHGDVMATDPIGEPFLKAFCVELKKGYSDECILDLFDRNNKGSYRKWLKKLEECRQHIGACSIMLVHQRDRRNAMIYLSKGILDSIRISGGEVLWWPCLFLNPAGLQPLVGMTMTHFFEYVQPDVVRRIAECSKSSG